MRRDSSHVMMTAAPARTATITASVTAPGDGSSPTRNSTTTSATSSTAAIPIASSHRHIAARRRIDNPSVTSSRIGPLHPSVRCATGAHETLRCIETLG
jgi:hypothetical protein